MELAVLDSRFRRAKLVQGWNSLVWTERYSSFGDFEMTSNNVQAVLEQLPLSGLNGPPCVVALRDSPVPMIVETHKIERDANGVPVITTTGRSFETVLDRRAAYNGLPASGPYLGWEFNADSPSDAAWFVMKSIVKDGISSVYDKIPEVTITDSVSEAWPDGTQKYLVEPQELYSWVLSTLRIGEHGLRASLPPANSELETIDIEIYNGADRRQTIVFRATQGQLEKTSHLLSEVGAKNTMVNLGQEATAISYMQSSTVSGLSRRVAVQDLTSDVTLTAAEGAVNLLTNKGKIALAGVAPIALFSGEISSKQSARYNQDYFLGDKVTLAGEFGLTQDVRVAEFVRTHDLEGERSYPAFEAITPEST